MPTLFKCFCLYLIFFHSSRSLAQMTSRGPRMGPPSPGMGSKYTYPQPPKVTPAGPELINPASQIPDHPEKYSWKLSNKYFATGSNPNDVPVYTFRDAGEGRTLVGQAKVGEEIFLDEVRVSMGRNHYKFKWNGVPKELILKCQVKSKRSSGNQSVTPELN
jgi:hypothetical protein